MANKLLKTLTVDSAILDIAQTTSDATDSSTLVATDEFVQNAIDERLASNVTTKTTTVSSVANGTAKTATVGITKTAGTIFIGIMLIRFPANSTGRRYGAIGCGGEGVDANFNFPTPSAGYADMTIPFILNTSHSGAIEVTLYQNSGGSMNVNITTTGYVITPRV